MSDIIRTSEEDELEAPIIEDVEPEPIKRDQLPQKDYYNKWNEFTSASIQSLEEEEEREKQLNDEMVGKNKYAVSEAQQKDQVTHERLKEAKKALDKRRQLDESAKYVWQDKNDETHTFQMSDFEGKRVIAFKGCNNCTYELPESLIGVIKVFVEHCDGLTLTLASKLITSYMEVSHCNNFTLNVEKNELHTLQVDLCNTININFANGLFKPGHRVFSAGMSDMRVSADGLTSHSDFIRDLAPVVMFAEERKLTDPKSEEQHFITQLVDGELLTEVALQIGDRWITRRELDMENVSQAQISQRQMQEMKDRAERQKREGNQAFQNAEYAQAAVHYTQAIDSAVSAAELGDPLPLLHICYSNRAACFLKLGQHEKALADADSCIGINAEFVKGHFRRGLALHAMGRYSEALPSLGKASSLENPKNKQSIKQIEEAIKFAEAKLSAQMRR